MKHGSNDLASVTTKIDVGSVEIRSEDLLYEYRIARQGGERLEKSAQAKELRPQRAEIEALSGLDCALGADRSLPEVVAAPLCCQIAEKASDRLIVDDMCAGVD